MIVTIISLIVFVPVSSRFTHVVTGSSSFKFISSSNSTNSTSDPHHHDDTNKKPTTTTSKPVVSPTRKTEYNYPTSKPMYKYPTKKPLNLKPPTAKPVYRYPSKKPVKCPTGSSNPILSPSAEPYASILPTIVSPSKVPSLLSSTQPTNSPGFSPTKPPTSNALPTLQPVVTGVSTIPTNSHQPSSEPSTVAPSNMPTSSCACNNYTVHSYNVGVNMGPGLFLCWNVAKPIEYFGVYASTDISFTKNLIITNPIFPSASVINAPSCSFVYDNFHPLTPQGLAYNHTGTVFHMSATILNRCGGQTGYFFNAGEIPCPNNLRQEVGSLQGASETELITTKDSKIIIGVVVSIILIVFSAIAMYILYHKYKTKNSTVNNAKENKEYDLEIFYSASSTNNNYANQYYSNNLMDSGSQQSE